MPLLYDLTNQYVSSSFQNLLQVSGSDNSVVDGLGQNVDFLETEVRSALTASFIDNSSVTVANAVSASSVEWAGVENKPEVILTLTEDGRLTLQPQTSEPTPTEGQIYYSSDDEYYLGYSGN